MKILWWLSLLGLAIVLHFGHDLNTDEGVTLNGAWNLFNGLHLYSDSFEFIPPGSFYLLFGIWKIFGVSFLAAKALAISLLFLGSIGLYKASRLIIGNRLINYVTPLAFIIISGWWPIINHNTFNLALLIWSSYFLIKGLDDLKKINFIASGLLAGSAILFLQQKGLALSGTMCLFLILLALRKKQVIYAKLTMLLFTASLVLLSLLCFWPSKVIFYNLIKYPFLGYLAANQISYNLLIISLIGWGVLSLILLAAKEKSDKVWFLISIQFFLLLTTYPLPDAYHISQAIFPSLLVIFYLAAKILIIYKQAAVKYLIIIFLTITLMNLLIFDLIVSPPSFIAWKKNKNYGIIEYINSNCPGRYIYSGPFLPNIYFETKKLNATPYSVLVTRQQTSEQFINALKSFRENKPSCAILSYPNSFSRFKHDQNNPLEEYIKTNYELVYHPLSYLFIYKNLENN